MGINYTKLSKTMSLVLRHEPWLFELELDNEGWVPMHELLAALRTERPDWATVTAEQIDHMNSIAEKQRFEVGTSDEGIPRIRALYGHSILGTLAKTQAAPPEVLFHGTSPASLEAIQSVGLLPMDRQYVHLSGDIETAKSVGKRKDKAPIILKISALTASQNGVPFYIGNEKVWLADHVPPEFIAVEGEQALPHKPEAQAKEIGSEFTGNRRS